MEVTYLGRGSDLTDKLDSGIFKAFVLPSVAIGEVVAPVRALFNPPLDIDGREVQKNWRNDPNGVKRLSPNNTRSSEPPRRVPKAVRGKQTS